MKKFAFFAGLIAALAVAVPPAAMAQPSPGSISRTTIVASGASPGLSGPVGIANPGDGSNRLFVIQQSGAVRLVRNGALQAADYLRLVDTGDSATRCAVSPGGTLSDTGFSAGDERGLLGIAFHPQFQSNGQFFLSYTDGEGDSIITRYTKSNPIDSDVVSDADLQTCLVIRRVDQDFSNHNGGNILFGPDGFLYFGLGDGGDANDPCDRAQTLDPATLASFGGCAADPEFTDSGGNANSRALLGKMVRLDVDATTPAGANGLCASFADGSANYAIPVSNPFSGNDAQSACDETWAYGLRNPWRFSFDRLTHDLLIGDVGQYHWEEIDLLPPNVHGANFGWKECEGRTVRGSCSQVCSLEGDVEPIIAYRNFSGGCGGATPAGCAVTAGYRYRGPDAALQGVYFYGDACNAELRYTVESSGTWVDPSTANIVTGLPGSVLAFGEDEVGALYMVAGDALIRIGLAAPDALFGNGFE